MDCFDAYDLRKITDLSDRLTNIIIILFSGTGQLCKTNVMVAGFVE